MRLLMKLKTIALNYHHQSKIILLKRYPILMKFLNNCQNHLSKIGNIHGVQIFISNLRNILHIAFNKYGEQINKIFIELYLLNVNLIHLIFNNNLNKQLRIKKMKNQIEILFKNIFMKKDSASCIQIFPRVSSHRKVIGMIQ